MKDKTPARASRTSAKRGRQDPPARQHAGRRGYVEPGPPAVRAEPTDPLPCTIVGLGASAGGVEAAKEILMNLRPDTGLAYVLVQHLSPAHESLLAEVLAGSAPIPVVQASEGMLILPNRVYVIPPNVVMTVVDGRLHLLPRPADKTQYNSIDAFFRSLAVQSAHPAVAVVLSGSTADGAAGLREVKAAGGVTIAQDPKTARYAAMPRAAITTGAVDMVLSPAAIGQELVRLGEHPFIKRVDGRTSPELAIEDDQLETLFRLLRGTSGVDFSHYKLPTIKRRLKRRMALHKLSDLADYLRLLGEHDGERRQLYRDLLIHVTRFFRDPESFEALRRRVLPSIVHDAADKRPIRVWVPGCATGEEAYSIAILLIEYLAEGTTSTPVQVFASDVSDEAIERARAGVYTDGIEADVSRERLRRFFTRTDGQYRVAKVVRDSCIFARQDLTRDPPFSKIDLIVCRNVLIYLDPRLQRKIIGMFHYALKPSGFLMLGPTEAIAGQGEIFALLDRKHKIYTRRAGSPRLGLHLSTTVERAATAAPDGIGGRRPRTNDLQTEVTQLLLSRYAPPAVLVDSDLQIVQTRGKTGPYLELASGDATLNLLKMAREGLLHGLRGAIQDVRKSGKPARRKGLIVKFSGTSHEVDVEVFPIAAHHDSLYFLIVFEHRGERHEAEVVATRGHRRTSKADTRTLLLEQELTSNREYLQSVIHDLEAANEELQSANEEILSSNEELQSTNEELDTAKEELQSANEELNTVNDELNARNEELSHLNSDLVNLLNAVPAAVVIVGRDLRIRRFTPMAEHVLSLIATDVGRPLGDVRPNIDAESNLEELTREVIDTVEVRERTVRDRTGRAFLLRVRPYKDQENRINGAVLAFTDAPTLKS